MGLGPFVPLISGGKAAEAPGKGGGGGGGSGGAMSLPAFARGRGTRRSHEAPVRAGAGAAVTSSGRR